MRVKGALGELTPNQGTGFTLLRRGTSHASHGLYQIGVYGEIALGPVPCYGLMHEDGVVSVVSLESGQMHCSDFISVRHRNEYARRNQRE